MKRLGLVKDDAHNRDRWKRLTSGSRPTLPQCGNEGVIILGLRSHDVKVNDDENDYIIIKIC